MHRRASAAFAPDDQHAPGRRHSIVQAAQTGPAGRKVQTIYFTVASEIKKEYYLAILLDRNSSKPVIVASTEGGMDIETVAHDTPEKLFKIIAASVSQ